jgi:hypothetical protein
VNQQEHTQRGEHGTRPFPYCGLVFVVLAVIGLFAVLVGLSRAFTLVTDKYTFFVLGGANILVFAAILLQALIYLRMAGQNERLISASEDNADAAREAFRIGAAPYFGIAAIAPEGFDDNYAPLIKVTFTNGGQTPAWHFHSRAKAVVGQTLDTGQVYDLQTGWVDLHNTFFRTNDSHTFEYQHHLFRYSPGLDKELTDGKSQIFVTIKIHYMDFREVWHNRDFRLVWDKPNKNFKDYDAEEQNCKACKKLASHTK